MEKSNVWDRQHLVGGEKAVGMGYEKKEAIGLLRTGDGPGQYKAESCMFACI